MMAGLSHISASMWMLLRGGCIVFVALMKQFALGDALTAQMWGVFTITVAVILWAAPRWSAIARTGVASSRAAKERARRLARRRAHRRRHHHAVSVRVRGEIVGRDQGAALAANWDGGPLWYTSRRAGGLSSGWHRPRQHHGVFEDLDNTMAQLNDNPLLMQMSLAFCVLVFILNSFSVLVTYMLSSVWHDPRQLSTDLDLGRRASMYSATGGAHGEKWTTGSYLQLAGLGIMLLGTAIYNGSIGLPCLPDQADLLSADDERSTAALSRSPLISKQPSGDWTSGATTSPYAKRVVLGNESGLNEPMLSKVNVQVRK